MVELTAFVGANDIGKSTILEALDAFFNDTVDAQDVNTKTADKNSQSAASFSGLPDQINLDAQSTTTLVAEHLLNRDGKLEIYKTWRATATKAEVERFRRGRMRRRPMRRATSYSKKRDELRQIVDQEGIEANKNLIPDMRHAIYQHLEAQGRLNLQDRDVETC